MIYSEKKDTLIPALFKAREQMSSAAVRNTENKHLKNTYANLESFLDAIRPALEANELMIIQGWQEGTEKNFIYLKTEIMHVSGQSVYVVSPFPITKADAHGVGSAITYARRYAIASLFGIAQADDDGNATRKTSTDVVKSIKQAESMDKAKEIYDFAKQEKYFGKDSAAMRVITAAYNEKKADLVQQGDGFTPAPAAKKEFQPEPATQPHPSKPEETDVPGDFGDF